MSHEKSLVVPDSIPTVESTIGDKEVDEKPKGQLKCGVWYKYSASRTGLVNDCDNISNEEDKRVGERVANAVNSGVQSTCDSLGCPQKSFRNAEWSKSCSNRLLLISCEVEFKCT